MGLHKLNRSALILSTYGALALTALLLGNLQGHPNLFFHTRTYIADYNGSRAISSILLGMAFGFFIVIITRVFQERSSAARSLHNEFHSLLASLTSGEILLLALSSSMGEELFFRGAIISFLESKWTGNLGMYMAILGSAALFSLLHIAPGKKFLSWTISSFLMGIFLAWMYVGIGDLFAPITAHYLINWLNLRDIVKKPRH